jgi:hypothetical protein
MNQRDPEQVQSVDPVDLSPAAIERRLDEVAQLYELGKYLTQATLAADSPVPPSDQQERSR